MAYATIRMRIRGRCMHLRLQASPRDRTFARGVLLVSNSPRPAKPSSFHDFSTRERLRMGNLSIDETEICYRRKSWIIGLIIKCRHDRLHRFTITRFIHNVQNDFFLLRLYYICRCNHCYVIMKCTSHCHSIYSLGWASNQDKLQLHLFAFPNFITIFIIIHYTSDYFVYSVTIVIIK